MSNLTKLASLVQSFDEARAFELGFAKAAAEYGLTESEYKTMCKIAAQVGGADFSKADASGSPTDASFRAQLAKQTGPAGKEATKNDAFLAQKKQQIAKAPPAPAAPKAPAMSQGPNPYPLGQ